jgi:hypothetical protein
LNGSLDEHEDESEELIITHRHKKFNHKSVNKSGGELTTSGTEDDSDSSGHHQEMMLPKPLAIA